MHSSQRKHFRGSARTYSDSKHTTHILSPPGFQLFCGHRKIRELFRHSAVIHGEARFANPLVHSSSLRRRGWFQLRERGMWPFLRPTTYCQKRRDFPVAHPDRSHLFGSAALSILLEVALVLGVHTTESSIRYTVDTRILLRQLESYHEG